MPTKLIQAAAITFVLHLLMGLSTTGTTQRAAMAIGQEAQATSLSYRVAELISSH